MNRRSFLASMLAACAAPAVVRAESIMRIKPVLLPGVDFDTQSWFLNDDELAFEGPISVDSTELSLILRRTFVPKIITEIYSHSPLLNKCIGRVR